MGALLAAADDPIALLGSTCEERASADYRARIRHDQEFVRMRGRRCEQQGRSEEQRNSSPPI